MVNKNEGVLMLPDPLMYYQYTEPTLPAYTNQVVYKYDAIVIIDSAGPLETQPTQSREDSINYLPPFTWFARDALLSFSGKYPEEKLPFYLFNTGHLVRALLTTSMRYQMILADRLLQSTLIYCNTCQNASNSILITAPEGIKLLQPTDTPDVFLFCGNQFIEFDNLFIFNEINGTAWNNHGLFMMKRDDELTKHRADTINVITTGDRELATLEINERMLLGVRVLAYTIATASIRPMGGGYINAELFKITFMPRVERGKPLSLDNIKYYLKK